MPGATLAATVRVSAEAAPVPGTGLGLKAPVMPVGLPSSTSVTGSLKFCRTSTMLATPLPPCTIDGVLLTISTYAAGNGTTVRLKFAVASVTPVPVPCTTS